ncbi:MAG: hypothetical protein ACREBC_37320, partial [Pyrinomonadaceae bacterium]
NIDGMQTHLIGLNTAICSCDNDDDGSLVADIRSLNELLRSDKAKSHLSEFTVVVTHHPIGGRPGKKERWLTKWNNNRLQTLLLRHLVRISTFTVISTKAPGLRWGLIQDSISRFLELERPIKVHNILKNSPFMRLNFASALSNHGFIVLITTVASGSYYRKSQNLYQPFCQTRYAVTSKPFQLRWLV